MVVQETNVFFSSVTSEPPPGLLEMRVFVVTVVIAAGPQWLARVKG